MATIRPIRPLRYHGVSLPDVVAPPYDVIDPEQRARLAGRSAHNIVHIDLPEGNDDSRYARAADLLRSWIESGVLRREVTPLLMRYDQAFDPPDGGARVTRRGFFALVRAEPYERRVILPHERTLSGPKEDRYKLFCATRAALSPVFLLYTDPSGAVMKSLESATPETELTTEDGITHRLARVTEPDAIGAVVRTLAGRTLLIADGHHRYETALRYSAAVEAERAVQGKPESVDGAHRWVLAFLADADYPGLVVFPTHRLVRGLHAFDAGAMLRRARETFEVRELGQPETAAVTRALADAGSHGPSIAAVFPDGGAAILSLRSDVDVARHPTLGARPPVLRATDVVLLHAAVLEGILGITPEAQAAQANLVYVKSASDGVSRARRGEGNVLFLMNPTPVSVVRRASEAGEVMPQKSTYFYPKVLTGLAIHVLDPEESVPDV